MRSLLRIIIIGGIASAGWACGTDPAASEVDPCAGKICKDEDGNPCTLETCDPKNGTCAVATAPDGGKCDDGKPCTVDDSCAAGKCLGTDKVCNDGDACTVNEKCGDDGKCTSGVAKTCDDNNPCTTDNCDQVDGCKNKPNSNPCDDGNPCTVSDACKAGSCAAGPAKDCDDGKVCTDDSCQADGTCKHATNTVACDDGNACTEVDVCASGACAGKAKVCDDNNPCTDDSCQAGTCKAVANTTKCDDGNACTESDVCTGGTCTGQTKNCDDANPCTDDACQGGACKNVANKTACDDGDKCTEADTCAGGKCGGTAKVCDDGKACTADTCDSKLGCVFAPTNGPCEDGDKCTEGDSCNNGQCIAGTKAKCDDGNVCKDWSCDPKDGCKWTAATPGKPCSDGDKCTDKDGCAGGSCMPGQTLACQDGNPCTDDSCDKDKGCQYVANTKPCDDKNACTEGDVCKDSACNPGIAKQCDDKQPCTNDQCDKVTGLCSSYNVTDGTPCEDASVCTNDTVCQTGKCGGGTKVVCKDDGNPCTSDACNDALGCKYPAQDGPCDADKNVCTVGDFCSAGTCVAGTIKSCDDGNVCTDDSCDPLKDCLHLNNTAPCDDKLLCTIEDTCKDGTCSNVKPMNCSDSNDCTEDFCDPKTACGHTNSLKGSACSDGQACSTGDACDGAGACKSSGKALWLKKEGTPLQDSYFATAVGIDGTTAHVGRVFTGSTFVGKLTGYAATGAQVFDTKPTKAGPQSSLASIAARKAGGFVAAGGADPNSTGWTAYTSYLVQINAVGKIEWEFTGTFGGSAAMANAVIAKANGDAVMVGTRDSPKPQGFIGEFNSAGALYGINKAYAPPTGFAAQYFLSIAEAPAGGYWVSAQVIYNDGSAGAARILRIQANGTETFDKILGKQGSGNYQQARRLVADQDGVTGFGYSGNGPYGADDIWVIRIDNSNNTVFEKHFGGAGSDSLVDALPAPGGGYFAVGYVTLAGETAPRGHLGKYSADGLQTWSRTLDQLDSVWRGVAMLSGSSLALGGYTQFQTVGDADLLLATCDLYGNCDCPSSGTCLAQSPNACDDKNPCTLDWCDAGQCKYAIGNDTMTCGTNQTCQKGKCL